MSPVLEVLLLLASLIAAVVWVLLYFFLIDGLLKRLVGSMFGVTIGRSQLRERYDGAHTHFYVSGWRVVEPKSGCLFDLLIWTIGGALRSVFVGVPVGALVLLALYLAYLVTRP